jgi:hypothetical protein
MDQFTDIPDRTGGENFTQPPLMEGRQQWLQVQIQVLRIG